MRVFKYILCVLIGLIVGLAIVAGAVAILLFTPLVEPIVDAVVSGDNSNVDEDGNFVYVNTDELSSIWDVIVLISDSVSAGTSNLSLGYYAEYIPGLNILADDIVDWGEQYGIVIDREALMECPFDGLGDFLGETVNNIEVYPLMYSLAPSYFESEDAVAVFMRALTLGKEADYYYDEDGTAYPVYVYNADITPYEAEPDGDGNVYFITDADGVKWQVVKTDGSYVKVGVIEEDYPDECVSLTGYWYLSDGEPEVVTAVTLEIFLDESFVMDSINSIYITSLMTDSEDNVIADMFGDYTVGDLLDGNIDFDDIEIAGFVDLNVEDDEILISVIYGVTNIRYDVTENIWNCDYTDADGFTHTCIVDTDADGYIKGIYYADSGEEVTGVTVSGISESINGLSLTYIMSDVDPSDAISMYIVFGVNNIFEAPDGDGYSYTATYCATGETAYIVTAVDSDGNEIVTSVYILDEDGNRVSTDTTLENVNDVLGNVQNCLTVTSVINVSPDESIMMYLAFSVTSVSETGDGTWSAVFHDGGETYDATLLTGTDGDGNVYVTGVVLADGSVYGGVSINNIGGQINGLLDDLTIGELMDISDDDTVLYALRNSSINGLAEAINGIAIQTFFTDSAYESTVTLFATYDSGTLTPVYWDGTEDISSYTFYYLDATSGRYVSVGSFANVDALKDAMASMEISEIYVYTSVIRAAVFEGDNYHGDGYYYYDEETQEYVVNGNILFSESYLYYTKDENSGSYELYNGDGKITLEEYEVLVSEGVTLYTYGEVSGVWKLIICEKDEEGKWVEVSYSLNEIDSLVLVTASNLMNSTMYELYDMGVLEIDYSTLTTSLGDVSGYENMTLGDLTITETLNLLMTLLTQLGS